MNAPITNAATRLTASATLLLACGCAVGLPHGPLEPSITADLVERVQADWGCAACAPAPQCACAGAACECEGAPSDYPPPSPGAPAPCDVACLDCPLGLPPAMPQPPYVDPGPPGRFFPVPVRPVFHPAPHAVGEFYPQAPARSSGY